MHINTKIALSVAAALAASSLASTASAANYEPWQYNGGGATYRLYMNGATAQDKGIEAIIRGLCTDGTMTVTRGLINSLVNSVYLCETNGNGGLTPNTKLALFKSSTGSGAAVTTVPTSVSTGTNVAFVNLTTTFATSQSNYTTASLCTIATTGSATGLAAYVEYNCGANLVGALIVPDAGVADVEPAIFGYVENSITHANQIDQKVGSILTFGVPVSRNFRNALQNAQKNQLPASCFSSGVTLGLDSPDCMPSLSKAQIASIFTGGITSYTQLSDDAGATIAAPAGSGTIKVCRRSTSSGTQASMEAYFLNNRCSKFPVISAPTSGAQQASSASLQYNFYASSTGVISCLNDHASRANPEYAIGVASIEFAPGIGNAGAYNNTGVSTTNGAWWANDNANWAWIAINGVAPTIVNAAQGRYDYAYEPVFFRRFGSNTGSILSGDNLNFFTAITTQITSLPVIKSVNTTLGQGVFTSTPWATGLLLQPGSPTAPSAAPAGVLTEAEVLNNPVAAWSRSGASGSPNSCGPAYIPLGIETGLDGIL